MLTTTGGTSTDSSTKPISKWITPAVTEEELEWANILTVDLSVYETRKSELVQTVATALQRDGFFYVVGHGIPMETVGLVIQASTIILFITQLS